ncbi:hypothetical protein [Halobacterium jilantaiense]|uniref:Uncharacterized protein n=1 Tax=Halobacterium jilantaiense TaxID=355548 RepID=A0A1I0NMZ1_9EURY|nr:hypothetical protein [Halobacterium jilantaiense]SEW02913.1 hypothetical protein SAMN04487945_1019 [Halobacterium jilantaiense]
MSTSQGTSSGTKTTTGDTEQDIGWTALRQLLLLGGALALAGAGLGVAGVAASVPLVWAFGIGASAVSLSVLAVTGYHGRAQSV